MRLWVSIILLLFALPICLVAADPVELSVPVRVLGSPPPPEPMNMQPARPQPPPELPRFLSQYQSMRTFRIDRGQAPSSEQSTERFILALPDRPLLLEATITIDGQPYEMIREQRIDRLIAELKKPVREAPEPAPQEEPIVKTTAISEAVDEDETKNEQLDPDDEPAEDEGEETASETELEVALIAVPSTALAARLRRYATVTGRVPTRDEVRWLLNKWVDGPTLLLLDENFQRFRATQAPAFHVLDRDMDGKISADELKLAPQTLSSCDVNQNDVVEYTELAEVANDPRRPHVAAATQLLLPIQDAISVAQSFRRLARRYASSESLQRFDPNSDGVLDAAEIAKLKELKPDVAVSISFDSKDPTKSRITVTYTSPDLAINVQQIRIRGSSITIPIGGTLLEFSAVQTGALNGSDQISVGMINDGYPLLPAIDPNEDGRLTIRELRHVLDDLRMFDTNNDGEISSAEILSTVRIAFGLGPCVHRHLADIRSVHAPMTATDTVAPPRWFTTMDANKDGDISPREFLLGPEQFKKLDVDNDGLISPTEAVASPRDQPTNVKQKPASTPEKATASP